VDATLTDPGSDTVTQLALNLAAAATFSPDGKLVAVANGFQDEFYIWDIS